MYWRAMEILEYENQIKVFQSKLALGFNSNWIYLDTFKVSDFDV